ncbi:DUF6979 family protein [Oceanithermus desulfurans]
MRYGIFEKTAVRATEMLQLGEESDPRKAWRKAICQFTLSQSTRTKGCPLATYLFLCQEGRVVGVPKGKYTDGDKNGKHALEALRLLKKDASWASNKTKLWKEVAGSEINHNQQLDVVLSLFDKDLLV